MRLARRASLLAALYLLTSASTASAECAWLLWAVSGTLDPKVSVAQAKVSYLRFPRRCVDVAEL
jgi:hypothetical protein